MSNQIAEEIAERLSIDEVLSFYGYPTNRRRRIPCPLHHGKNPNFCYTDKVYHCWTCGAKGNLITLAMELHGITFSQALLKLNNDFRLGLTASRPTIRDRREMAINKKIDKAIREIEDEKRAYYRALQIYHRVLYEKTLEDPQDLELEQIRASLEEWLDENNERVVQPWQLDLQKKII